MYVSGIQLAQLGIVQSFDGQAVCARRNAGNGAWHVLNFWQVYVDEDGFPVVRQS